MRHELPMLFPPPTDCATNRKTVPTLVLHGHKNLHARKNRKKENDCYSSKSYKSEKKNLKHQNIKLSELEVVEILDSDPEAITIASDKLYCSMKQQLNNKDVESSVVNIERMVPEIIDILDSDQEISLTNREVANEKDEVELLSISTGNHSKRKISNFLAKSTEFYVRSQTKFKNRQDTLTLGSTYREPKYHCPSDISIDTEETDRNNKFVENIVDFNPLKIPEHPFTPISEPLKALEHVVTKIEEPPPEEGWMNRDGEYSSIHNGSFRKSIDTEATLFGPSVHLTEVLPRWRKPDSTNRTASCLKSCAGVHHPKYMLLFECSGSIVVVVSTANLTQTTSIDACWIQRFESKAGHVNAGDKMDENSTICDGGSDFGTVLCDFLHCQSIAARSGHMLPLRFLQTYLDIPLKKINGLKNMFRFERAQVHLVSTVPGNHSGHVKRNHLRNTTGKNRTSNNFLRKGCIKSMKISNVVYGPQRVHNIVARLQTRNNSLNLPWFPSKMLSNNDRLVIQTTSFGGNWKRKNLEELISLYLGHDSLANKDIEFKDVLDLVDIIWPTKTFIDTVNEERLEAHKVCSSKQRMGKIKKGHSFCFFSSKNFNDIDLCCLSRMKIYENQKPSPVPWSLCPHLKTYARVIGQNSDANKYHSMDQQCTSYDLAWLMLTSACLSHGAQGKVSVDRSLHSDEMSYANFELGVLFCSRLNNSKNDRVYCSHPFGSCCNDCQFFSKHTNYQNSMDFHATRWCDGKKYEPKVIVLPLPYNLNSSSYQADDDDANFSFTPYFHEIIHGTENYGQMTLTPYGKNFSTKKISNGKQ